MKKRMPRNMDNMSVDEKLFFNVMRMPHVVKRNMFGDLGPKGPEGHGRHCGPEGPGKHGGHGHGHHRKMRAFAQARVLEALIPYEDGVRQKALVEEMGVNPSSMSELISKLEGEGYVARTVDPEDKRATLIALTEVGRARAYELEDERQERFAKLFTNLTEKEKEQLLKLLEKLAGKEEE